MQTRKILYSPGFGAGWVSWHCGSIEQKQFMLTYQPFIDALERGESITSELEEQFEKDYKEKFGENADLPYTGGLSDLAVAEVSGPVRITEYDGSESYEQPGEEEWL